MNTKSSPPVESTTAGPNSAEPEEPEEPDEDAAPRELESALLTLAMFGGLVVFAVGCTMLGWN